MASLILVTIGLVVALFGFPLLAVGLIMLIVSACRHKRKKPAIIITVIALVLIVGGFSLSAIDTDAMFDDNLEEVAKEEVERLIADEYSSGAVTVKFEEEEKENDRYIYSGSFRVRAHDGTYMGVFEIVLRYNGYDFDVVKSDISPAVNEKLF